MKADLPILGQPSISNKLLSMDLFAQELMRIDTHAKALHDRIKIHELRKSCGVKDEQQCTVNVRLPPRYRSI